MEQELRIRALCKLYLGAPWNSLPDEMISVRPLGQGCSNSILTATATADDSGKTIDKVLVRLYGENISQSPRLSQDIFLTTYLGYHLGTIPKLRGLFDGGRLEEYIPSRNMTREEFQNRYKEIIGMASRLHNLPDLPLPKDPFLKSAMTEMLDKLNVHDRIRWAPEVNWYLIKLAALGKNMDVGFCHNDINMNNILIPENDPDKLILIDYEYAGYNYTLFDIANYCSELQYDWSHPIDPYFLFDGKNWLPDEKRMLEMIRFYKSQRHSIAQVPEKILLKQLKFMLIGSELVWNLWSMAFAGVNIDLNQYKTAKSNSYFDKKKSYMNEIDELLQENIV